MCMRLLPFVLLLVSACGPGTGGHRPNVLLVTMDTLRRDAVGCYGRPGALTPHMDRLAGEGVLFVHAQTSVPLTLPSHISMLTGLYPASHGVRVNGFRPEGSPSTLAVLLGAKGYDTAAFVASQVLSRSFGVDRGFAFYDDAWGEKPKGRAQGEHEAAERKGDAVVAAFETWLEARKGDEPFFAWVHFYDPHRPLNAPVPYLAAAGGDPYAAEVAFTDGQLGRVLDALARRGLEENTVLVAIGDHGEGNGEHGEDTHGFLLYESTISVPWILRYPGGPRGRIVESPVGSVDLLPTLASLLGLGADPAWQGKSLLALVQDGSDARPPLYSESYFGNVTYQWAPLHALREGDWKLLHGSRDALFDLASDPGETRNLAESEPEVVARLRGALESVRSGLGKPDGGEVEAVLTAEQRAMFEALNYLAPSYPITESDTLPDPMERYPAHELLVAGQQLDREGKTGEARAKFEKALRFDPKNTQVIESLAASHRKAGNFAEEESLLRAILAIDPDDAPAWNNLGNVILRTGRTNDEALACYHRALEIDSGYAPAYVNLGNQRLSAGDPNGALGHYNHALRLERELAMAHYGKALAYKSLGNAEKHVQELRATLALDPGFEPARKLLESYAGASRRLASPFGANPGLFSR